MNRMNKSMSEIGYHVELTSDPDGGFVVTCVDVPELTTCGEDRADALASAREAMAVALFGYLEDGRDLPDRTITTGEFVSPETLDTLKIAVVDAWRKSGMSKSEFGRQLGVDEKEARRILDPDRLTKLGRLEKALDMLGRRVRIVVEAA